MEEIIHFQSNAVSDEKGPTFFVTWLRGNTDIRFRWWNMKQLQKYPWSELTPLETKTTNTVTAE